MTVWRRCVPVALAAVLVALVGPVVVGPGGDPAASRSLPVPAPSSSTSSAGGGAPAAVPTARTAAPADAGHALAEAQAAPAATRPTKVSGVLGTTVFRRNEVRGTCYRIPGIVRMPSGRLLAFAEQRFGHRDRKDRRGRWVGRVNPCSDNGRIRIVMKTSDDGGRSWSKIRRVVANSVNRRWGTINPSPVVDRATGRVVLLFEQDVAPHADHSSTRVYAVRSSKGGTRWGTRRAISPQLARTMARGEIRHGGIGPGHGVQLEKGPHRGRLVATWSARRPGDATRRVRVIWSDDHGRHWRAGGDARTNSVEPTLVELADGRLYMGLRRVVDSGSGENRASVISTDGGATLGRVAVEKDLPTPMVFGSLARLADGQVVFASPKFRSGARYPLRFDQSLWLSQDRTRTWRRAAALWSGPSGYSDMTPVRSGVLGVVFERGAGGARRGGRAADYARRIVYRHLDYGAAFERRTRPRVTGTERYGQVLSVARGTWRPAPTAMSYQWLRDGRPIRGATASRHRVKAVDTGHRLSVRVTVRRSGYLTWRGTTRAVSVAPLPRLVATGRARVEGRARVGHRLTAHRPAWRAGGRKVSPHRVTYRWYRAGRPIHGATHASYRLTRADRGHHVRVRVTVVLRAHRPGHAVSRAVAVR